MLIKEHNNFEEFKRKILLRSIVLDNKVLKSRHLAQLAWISYKEEKFQEAKDYINSKKIFVSESIMISSANDNKTIIIEIENCRSKSCTLT